MTDNLSNNPVGENTPEKKVEATRLSLTDRVGKYYQEKNEWRQMNGGCPITANIDETLAKLRDAVKPREEDLPAIIKASIENFALPGQTVEQIWADKIAEGANYIGVVDGIFGFYKGDEKLPDNTKPLLVPGTPVLFEYKQKEREMVMQQAKLARLSFKSSFESPKALNQNLGEGGIVEGAAPTV